MTSFILPKDIEKIFELENADSILSALMTEIVELLKCDRCFLYIRHPETRLGKVPFCYRRTSMIPEIIDRDWKTESPFLEGQDPMFAAALQCQPTIFVEDVETAPPEIVNRQFERENFGHRALIHAHLCGDGKLWGILQPCVFAKPRTWTESERKLIQAIAHKTTPLVIEYLRHNLNIQEIEK
jgi:GAF domain-containing protein